MVKYQIIYADPPWKYGGSHSQHKWMPANWYYPVMSFDELKELKVADLADDNCLLWLWVVSPAINRCIEVGEAWGFNYSTVGFVWHKRRANNGNYTMSQCELCLIFKKGKIPKDRIRKPGVLQFLMQKVGQHSEKPDECRRRIEQMFPLSKKVELFAKKKVEGWDSMGMEINGKAIDNEIGEAIVNVK